MRDKDGKGVPAVIVSAEADGILKAYSISDEQGGYSLSVSTNRPFYLNFRHISYKEIRLPLKPISQTVDAVLEEGGENLRAAVVSVPVVRLQGDTLSFYIPQLIRSNDYSLEDAIRRIPGIDIDDNGIISYMGRRISKFYIDGTDLTGGKYTLLTEKVRAEMVEQVEVLSNHHDIKMENKGGKSENVALNVRLKKEYKMRPVGSTGVATGASEGKILYDADITFMHFNDDFPVIASFEVGNENPFASRRADNHYTREGSSHIESITGQINVQQPPIAQQYYRTPMDLYTSFNGVKKLKDPDKELRINADYALSKSQYMYDIVSSYYYGEESFTMNETVLPFSSRHWPQMELEYKHNGEKTYTSERFTVKTSFSRESLLTESDGDSFFQERNINSIKVANHFIRRFSLGEHSYSWNLDSGIKSNPLAGFAFSKTAGSGVQDGEALDLTTSIRIGTSRRIGRINIGLPLSYSVEYETIKTSLNSAYMDGDNDVVGTGMKLSFSPSAHYVSPRRNLDIKVLLPLIVRSFAVSAGERVMLFTPEPSLDLFWTISARNSIYLNSSLTRDVGNLLDFLPAPTLLTYRSLRNASGVLHDTGKFESSIRHNWRLPMEMFNVLTNVKYGIYRSNLMVSNTLDKGIIVSSNIPVGNTSNDLELSSRLSKRFHETGIGLSAGGRFGRNDASVFQNAKKIRHLTETYVVDYEFKYDHISWMDIRLTGSWRENSNRFLDRTKERQTFKQQVYLSFLPLTGLDIHTSHDYINSEISEDVYKQFTICDAGIKWSHKHWRLSFDIRNLLGTKDYFYTIFDGLDYYTFTCHLRGRQYILGVVYNW